MKSIMIDMDDVLTSGNFERIINEYLGYSYDFESFHGYRLQDVLQEKKHDFFLWMREIDVYQNAHLMDHCYDVLFELNQKYEVYIVTDYAWPDEEMLEYNGKFIGDKYRFLRRELPFLKPNQFVFLSNKKLFCTDIKIDDKIDNLENTSKKILFRAYHNERFSKGELEGMGVTLVHNWEDIRKILL